MQLTAVFESWHIGDGNYPPLHRGQLVRLAFELEPDGQVAVARSDRSDEFSHHGDAEYRGCGILIRKYIRGSIAIAVIQAGTFRFYIHNAPAINLPEGARVEFRGTLLLDHFLWAESLGHLVDPPELFYNLRVVRIRRVAIPEKFVSRSNPGLAYPTRVGPAHFEGVTELETMEGQEFGAEFYVLDFDESGPEDANLHRTFL